MFNSHFPHQNLRKRKNVFRNNDVISEAYSGLSKFVMEKQKGFHKAYIFKLANVGSNRP